MTAFTCNQFFDGDVLHGPTCITVNDGLVTSVEPHSGHAEFHLISPGYVDLQMNGFDKWDVSVSDATELRELDECLSQHGTTSWLGTIVTAPLDRLNESLERLNKCFTAQTVPGFIGVHIEGPFLGQSPGAHNPNWIVPVELEWLTKLPSSVRLVTLAGEQGDAARAIQVLNESGIVASLGHSQPTRAEFLACVDAGASMVTHLFNGMSGVHHRNDGLALMALTTDSLKAGLIADLVHTSPEAINLAFRAKGDNGIVLVSDSVAWKSEWAQKRGVAIVDGSPRLPDRTLAGSSTPLSQCVANAVRLAGVPLSQALRAATSTPADLLRSHSIGRITVGRSADVIALDDELSVVRTWRRLPSECA
jgi:N-acetylglucosamine-6-phosphate deacetylase